MADRREHWNPVPVRRLPRSSGWPWAGLRACGWGRWPRADRLPAGPAAERRCLAVALWSAPHLPLRGQRRTRRWLRLDRSSRL